MNAARGAMWVLVLSLMGGANEALGECSLAMQRTMLAQELKEPRRTDLGEYELVVWSTDTYNAMTKYRGEEQSKDAKDQVNVSCHVTTHYRLVRDDSDLQNITAYRIQENGDLTASGGGSETSRDFRAQSTYKRNHSIETSRAALDHSKCTDKCWAVDDLSISLVEPDYQEKRQQPKWQYSIVFYGADGNGGLSDAYRRVGESGTRYKDGETTKEKIDEKCGGSGTQGIGQSGGFQQQKDTMVGSFDPMDAKFLATNRTALTTVHTSSELGSSEAYSTTLTYILRRVSPPGETEMILSLPDGFENWRPVGGPDEKTMGSAVPVTIDIHRRGGRYPNKKVKYLQFVLVECSQEPGVCINFPAAKLAKRDYDLRISGKMNKWLTVDKKDGQSGDCKNPDFFYKDVWIECFDHGAYGKLWAFAVMEDGEQVFGKVKNSDHKELAIPQDENHNHIADCWEKQMGVYQKNLPANWDGAWTPGGQACDGDGLTLYEKYRGMMIDGEWGDLRPQQKYLFVYDPGSHSGQAALDSLERILNLRIITIGPNDWSGPGSSANHKRVVNFNRGANSRGEQHALQTTEMGDYTDLGGAGLGNVAQSGLLVCPDGAGGGGPAGTREILVFRNKVSAQAFCEITDTRALSPEFDALRKEGKSAGAVRFAAMQALENELGNDTAQRRFSINVNLRTQHLICVGLGHGVGLKEHAQVPGFCLMHVPTFGDSPPPQWNDPFWFIRFVDYPPKVCCPDCWKKIKVTDGGP